MIRTIKIEVNAAYPQLPLEPVKVFAGSAASFTILNVPRAVGNRAITNVTLAVTLRGGGSETFTAVRVGSAYEVTIPAARLANPYSAALGVRVIATGTDENGGAATWVMGVADLAVLNNVGEIVPGANVGDVRHSEFADLDADTATLADVITRLKGTTAMITIAATLAASSLFAALPVAPVYTNHNRVAGNTLTMTNISAWAAAVEDAIAGGTAGGLNTNAVKQLIESETGGTNTILHAESDPQFSAWKDDGTETFAGTAENAIQASVAEVATSATLADKAGGIIDSNTQIELSLSQYNPDGTYRWKSTIFDEPRHVAFIETEVAPVAAAVAGWENYWTGEKVRISITNYYGGTSGEPPRMRVEEFSHSVTNGTAVTNVYRVVWDELTRQTNYQHQIDVKVDGISNTVMTAAFMQTSTQLAGKAPRAWGEVTSAGAAAPPGMVWHTEPNTMFAGGTEYAHVAVGEGVICVLADSGAPVYTEGEEGKFRFKDDSGQYYFGFDVRESYTIGCRTDGISVAGGIVSLTYDLISADNPEVLHTATLTNATWEVQTVTWEQNPPAGTKICYINVGDAPSGFYKAQMTYAGGAKFVTNMGAEFQGGIMATNETGVTTATQLPIYPAITSTGVVWRVNWGN